MKKVVILIALTCVFLPYTLFADQICPLVGKTFTYSPPKSKVTYKLTDFECAFGPGCCGVCSLWYGDFKQGPLYRKPLDFSCIKGDILIAGLPCFFDVNATELVCIPVSMKKYHEVDVHGKIFYIPKNVDMIQFEEE